MLVKGTGRKPLKRRGTVFEQARTENGDVADEVEWNQVFNGATRLMRIS